MVVVYLDHLQRSSYMYHLDAPYTTVGGQFLGFLKYWGEDFDYGGMGIILEPPSIVPKTPGLPVSYLNLPQLDILLIEW